MYTEYLVEYSEDLMVYVSGLDEDGFWDHITSHEDVNNPYEFAEGYAQRMRDEGKFVTVAEVESDQD